MAAVPLFASYARYTCLGCIDGFSRLWAFASTAGGLLFAAAAPLSVGACSLAHVLAMSWILCMTPSRLNDTWKASGSFCIRSSAICSAFTKVCRSWDLSSAPIRLDTRCFFTISSSNSGCAWYNSLRIAFMPLCLIASPTVESQMLYNTAKIPLKYDEAACLSSCSAFSRSSSLPAAFVFVAVAFGGASLESVELGLRCTGLAVPVSSFICSRSKARS